MADVTVRTVFEDTASAGLLGVFSVMETGANIVTGLRNAIDLVAGAFDAAVGFAQPFVDSASESQIALTQLNTVLKSTHDAAGLTTDQLIQMSAALQLTTKFSDEQIQSAETMLLRYENINSTVFPQAIQLTTDLATSLGVDLTSAARMVGMALDDPAAGIGRLNTQFRVFDSAQMDVIKHMAETGDVAGAQALIIQGLTDKFGGAAVAIGLTFAGQLDIAKNKLDDIKELIGGALLPILTNLLDDFIAFANQPQVIQFFTDLANSIANILNGTTTLNFSGLIQAFSDWTKGIDWGKISDDIAAGINSIDWNAIGAAIGPALNTIGNTIIYVIEQVDWGALGNALGHALAGVIAGLYGYPNWNALKSDFQKGFEYALSEPFGDVNFSQLGTDFINGFRYIGQQLASAFGYYGWDAWNQLWDDFQTGWNYTLAKIKSLLGIASPSTVFAGIGQSLVQGLINGWESLFTTFKNIVGSSLDDILQIFAPLLALFGITLPTGTGGTSTGSVGGQVQDSGTGGSSTTTSGGQCVTNYFYGTVYIGTSADLNNGMYDCPSPNPFVTATSGIVGGTGGGATGKLS